jgi:ubiquinone/menaquinone biosynthesis C-methylase UbiE
MRSALNRVQEETVPASPVSVNWHAHWKTKTDGEHRFNSPEAAAFYARELMLYFPNGRARALELGCGAGDQFRTYQERFSSYVGIDVSSRMLEQFRASASTARLLCGDIARLPLRKAEFDLVFSNGVAQYLNPSELAANLAEVRRVLVPGGVYLIANIPDAHLRFFYYAGALRSDVRASWRRLVRSIGAEIKNRVGGRPRRMGNWYARRQVVEAAKRQGLACRTFSSASYEYRFHALCTAQDSGQ